MSVHRAVKVFESHTKDDTEFCDIFDRACARVGIDAFRSEYETIEPPAWQTIRDELSQSQALFFLIGRALVEAQEAHTAQWEYTQNWISYEIGIASALDIDIWVLCDGVKINFPVPYFNNYIPYTIRTEKNFKYLVMVLQDYQDGLKYNITEENKIECPYYDCGIVFNLHAVVKKESKVVCPCCLRNIVFPKGHLLKE